MSMSAELRKVYLAAQAAQHEYLKMMKKIDQKLVPEWINNFYTEEVVKNIKKEYFYLKKQYLELAKSEGFLIL